MKKRATIFTAALILVVVLRPVSTSFLNLPYSTVINDDRGDLLSASIAEDHQWRFPILSKVPTKFEKCILTFEDKRFYYHPGIDPLSLARAVRDNLKNKKIVSGASTLTMQLSRLIHQHSDRSFSNKFKELIFALRLELWHGKKNILNWYSSMAPFGGNVVGLEAACWRYFNKTADQLSWAEAATLAVLPNAPSLIHVNKNRNQLKAKRDRLLQKLYDIEVITIVDLEAALSEGMPSRTYALPNLAPHYLQFVKSSGENKHDSNIRPQTQIVVGNILNEFYHVWSQNEIQNAGCVILDTKTGEVISYHGNIPITKYEAAVDMVQAKRSSGSILKPFLYAHMIDEGLISPNQLLFDIPTIISGFQPSNYNKKFTGAVNADEALQRSLNVPAVRTLREYGIEKFLFKLKEHELTTLSASADHYGLSLILGGGEVTLWELANAYRNMAASLTANKDSNILSKGSIYQTFETLKGLQRPNEEGSWQQMSSRVPVAWKTGTSYGHRDAWAIGVTPEVTIATWVGNADGEGRDNIIGTSTAGILLFEVVGALKLDGSWFRPPFEEMMFHNLCSESGHLASPNCPKIDTMYYPTITELSTPCPYHRIHFTTLDGLHRVGQDCLSSSSIIAKVYLELPPQVAEYYRIVHPELESLPPFYEDCQPLKSQTGMEIVYPQKFDVIYLPIDLNGDGQEVVARASHEVSDSKLFWYLDQEFLGTTIENHKMSISPESGEHTLTVVDQNGYSVNRNFEVLAKNQT